LPFIAAYELFIFSRVIFEQLGFTIITGSRATPEESVEEFLLSPDTEHSSPEGQETRMKLLRFWVEISAYLVDYQRRFGKR